MSALVAVDLGATHVTASVDRAGPARDDGGAPPARTPSSRTPSSGTPSSGTPGPLDPVDVPGCDGVVEPAAVFAPADGTALNTGGEARRRAAADPSRYEPRPRLRVDEDELLLGTRVVGVAEACGAVLADALHRAGPLLRGERPRRLVLTHPPGWDSGRLEVLRRSGSGLAERLELVAEPVAAAAHARWMRPRGAAPRGPMAVLDLGAVAARATVLEATGPRPGHVEVVAHRADEGFGGDDADELLLAHLLAGLDGSAEGADDGAVRVHEVAAGATLADRRHRQVLIEDVRAAKERLSDAEQAPVVLPGRLVAAWLSRAELEDVLRPALRGLVALLADTVAAAGTTPERLAGVWLTGGGARVPLLGALVHRELGVPATVAPEPRTVVAHGALVVGRDLEAAVPTAAPEPGPSAAVAAATAGAAAVGGLGVLAAAARGPDGAPGAESAGASPAGDLGPGAGRDAARHGPDAGPAPPPPLAPPRPGAPAPRGAGTPAAPGSGPFPVGPASGPFPVGPFPVARGAAGAAGGAGGGPVAAAPSPPASAPGWPFPTGGPARGAPPPRRPAASPRRDPDPSAYPPPRDPDDTGEILDDSWDGRWDDDELPGARPPAVDDRPTHAHDTHARPDDDPWATGPAWGAAAWAPVPAAPPSSPAPPAPPARPATRSRRRLATAGAVLALVVATVGLVVGLTRGGASPVAGGAAAPGEVTEDAWGHRFTVPAGWVRSGGTEADRRLVLRRAEEPRGIDLIAVQTGPLAPDLAEDPGRVRAQIADQYEQARAAGDPVSGLELRTTVAGRDVTRYRQQVAPGVRLDWIVLVSGSDQVSVGCRHADDGGVAAPLPAACEAVVASLDATGD